MLFRTAIRELTVRQIKALNLFEAVFNARAPVIVREQLPCCKVWTPTDQGPNLSIGVPEIREVVDLVIQIVIEGTEDEANSVLVDNLCEAVVLWLVEDANWQVSFEKLVAMSTEVDTSVEGEMRTVTATITMQLQYNYLFITRIQDLLHTMDIKVIVPEQPPGPGGEPGDAHVRIIAEVESEHENWPSDDAIIIGGAEK